MAELHNRRQARELALQTLYAVEQGGDDEGHVMLERLAEYNNSDPRVKKYACSLIDATLENRTKIDVMIQKHAANWDLKRMNAIDRNLMRMSIAELMVVNDVPFKVILDEAIEIAKVYGTDDSGKFVNGILDSVYYKEINPGASKSEIA